MRIFVKYKEKIYLSDYFVDGLISSLTQQKHFSINYNQFFFLNFLVLNRK